MSKDSGVGGFMGFDHLNGTVPTVHGNHRTAPKTKIPSKPLLEAITARIKGQKRLYGELCAIWGDAEFCHQECLRLLVDIIARGIIRQGERTEVTIEKRRAIDGSEKTRRRWEYKTLPGAKRRRILEKFTQVAHREIIARNAAEVTAAKKLMPTKDYYPRLVRQLFYFFKPQTPHPLRYVSAIVALFGLHPKIFCDGCQYLPAPRQRNLKSQSLTTQIRRVVRMCKLNDILACPKQKSGRQYIWARLNR
jgi:hypothetical protein